MEDLKTNKRPSFNNKQLQLWLNVMMFFLAFPSIYLFQNSIYFYAFIVVLLITKKITGYFFINNTFNKIIFLLLISGLISSILHPLLKFDPGFWKKVNMVLHFAYWFAIGAYFASWLKFLNVYLLAKWISIGFFVQVIAFYFFNIKIDMTIFKFVPGLTRNSFVFNTICFSGFLLFFLYQKIGKLGMTLGSFFVLISLIYTNGRAGGAIGFILLFLSMSLIYPIMRYFTKISLIFFIVIFIFTGFSSNRMYKIGNMIAPYVENINPRFSKLLQGEGEGDLSIDKSWLLRKLMVDKSFDILSKRPIFGIGFGNFSKYGSDLSTYYQYERLQYLDGDYLNTRSAHNSYAGFAAETGIIGFILLLLLLVPQLFWFLKVYWQGNYNIYIVISVSFIGALIHMYTIASITGANIWLLLGVTYSLKNK